MFHLSFKFIKRFFSKTTFKKSWEQVCFNARTVKQVLSRCEWLLVWAAILILQGLKSCKALYFKNVQRRNIRFDDVIHLIVGL